KVGIMPFIFRDVLYNELSTFAKIWNLFLLGLLFFLLLPSSIFIRDRAKVSLILLELTEAALLADLIKKYKVRELYIFSAFEKDIIFLSHFLGSVFGVKITIVPSSNPISLYYRRVICHTFIFTAPFQEKEFELLKKDWHIQAT